MRGLTVLLAYLAVSAAAPLGGYGLVPQKVEKSVGDVNTVTTMSFGLPTLQEQNARMERYFADKDAQALDINVSEMSFGLPSLQEQNKNMERYFADKDSQAEIPDMTFGLPSVQEQNARMERFFADKDAQALEDALASKEAILKQDGAVQRFMQNKIAAEEAANAEIQRESTKALLKEADYASKFIQHKETVKAAVEKANTEALLGEADFAAKFVQNKEARAAEAKEAYGQALKKLDHEVVESLQERFAASDKAFAKQEAAKAAVTARALEQQNKLVDSFFNKKAEIAEEKQHALDQLAERRINQAEKVMKKKMKNFAKEQKKGAEEARNHMNAAEEKADGILSAHFKHAKKGANALTKTETKATSFAIPNEERKLAISMKNHVNELPANQRLLNLEGLDPMDRAEKLFEIKQMLYEQGQQQKHRKQH